MTPQEQQEVNFWKNLYNNSDFRAVRLKDLNDKTEFFPEIFKEKGAGLDLGSGLLSIFSLTSLKCDAYDPLSDYYEEILPGRYIKEIKKVYDWIFCCNVIDHTPDPKGMIELIKKHCKGRLYFEVNFDDELSPAHYKLWRIEDVREYLKDFKLIKERVQRNPSYPQDIYQAIYEI